MQIDEIYCSMQNMEEKIARYLIKQADSHMIRIKFLPDFYQVLRRRSTINYMGTVPILSIRQEPLTVDSNLIIKRVFDFFFSLFVIVFILSWLIPIIGLLIKLESKGPIFFKQDRSGINNKPFKVYKFRSMRTVKGVGEDCQAVKDDIRLTKLGGFLRRTSLDELPQFVNVLLGNMTVVGPRPHMLSHTDKFSKEVDTYMVRHFAKPGITGWAQVNGCRGETRTVEAIEERVLHDVWYIENWSLTLDLKIIFLTVWNILRGEDNAY
jgi:Undecaprenyl-phosphate glucose phosphotransferase